MTYKLLIRPLATIEIIDAFDWYNLQKEGLGNDFLQELDSFYKILLQNSKIPTPTLIMINL